MTLIYKTDFEQLKNYKPPYAGTKPGMAWNIENDSNGQYIVVKDKGNIVIKISCNEVIENLGGLNATNKTAG